MTENPRYCAVAQRLSSEAFDARDKENASDVVDDGKGNRLRILALTYPDKIERRGMSLPDVEIILDPEAVASIRTGLAARLKTVFERDRSPRSASQA